MHRLVQLTTVLSLAAAPALGMRGGMPQRSGSATQRATQPAPAKPSSATWRRAYLLNHQKLTSAATENARGAPGL